MKFHKLAALATGLTSALVLSSAFADDQTTTSSTTTTAAPAQAAPTTYTVAPPVVTAQPAATSTTVVNHDKDNGEIQHEDDTPRVKSGVGLGLIGVLGTTDQSRLGVGGRLEFITPIGLTIGGSYTQHFGGNNGNVDQTTSVRPLLGEIGMALPVARHVEIRPMLGLGYAFVNTSSTGNGAKPGDNGGSATASVAASGFDAAPGVKVSYMASGLEVFTMPKYHVIKDLNFFALEVGAGARF